uniref:hAT-like transposase RNase-H fold domain-containing protein n=1 Tax=Fagus sylvatica TaxID=28930 RepID=A0A2N9J4P9_FAGSY
MSTHETIGSSNPSSSSTPIGSSESPLMVDEDNGTPCSSPTPMDAQIDGQPENKDVEGIGKLTSNVLLEWNIDRKLSTVTMDNCSTNDAVINIIIDKLQRSSLVMCGSMLHMRCAAHVLNLIVQDGLSVIGPCIEKVCDSVGFWTASTKRRQRESAYNCMPNEEDWEIASDICQRLSLFYKVTEVFSGTSYPTANLFFPKEYYFPIIYGDQADDEIQRIRDICYEMLRDYNSGRMGKEANRGTCTVEALMCAQNWLWAGIKGTSSTKEEDMDIQNILDDYDDEDESGVTRVEESKNDS